jgi:hypothetical protein
MRAVTPLALVVSILVVLGSVGPLSSLANAFANPGPPAAPQAAVCTSSAGPGIPPPASVSNGIAGFHAAWYGQSGYMTLCPGDTMVATVAMYNTGSNGWVKGVLGQAGYLGTWNPVPGQDQPSAIGGDGQLGSPNTGWPRYNRVAQQPADYVGPGQVAWFQFGVRGPATPGTYDLYIRPLIEGAQWMEDYGIFWRITVPPTTPVGAPAKLGCTATPSSIVSGSTQTSTITVNVQDANGLNVTTNNGTSITLSQAGTVGSLDGLPSGQSSTKVTVNGVASWTLTPPPAGTTGTDQLSASSGFLTGCLVNVNFTVAGAPASIATTLGQTEFPSGSVHTTSVTGTLKDANGATTSFTTAHTMTFSVDNATICSVSPQSVTVGAGANSASSTVTTTGVPGNCTVTAAVAGLTSGSATLGVTSSGPASKLVITGNTCSGTPTTVATPGSTCAVTVQVQDAAGNKVFGPTPVTLHLYRPGTTTNCGAAVVSTVPAGGSGNPAIASTASTGTTVQFNIGDATAESCDATATSGTLAPASATISFSGFGTPTQLTATVSPNPIPANGVSTSTITICLKDAGGNTVTTATDAISLLFTSSTGGANHATTRVTSSPQTMSGGCAPFVVQSTMNPPATDTYTASDLTRVVPNVNATITTN